MDTYFGSVRCSNLKINLSFIHCVSISDWKNLFITFWIHFHHWVILFIKVRTDYTKWGLYTTKNCLLRTQTNHFKERRRTQTRLAVLYSLHCKLPQTNVPSCFFLSSFTTGYQRFVKRSLPIGHLVYSNVEH